MSESLSKIIGLAIEAEDVLEKNTYLKCAAILIEEANHKSHIPPTGALVRQPSLEGRGTVKR